MPETTRPLAIEIYRRSAAPAPRERSIDAQRRAVEQLSRATRIAIVSNFDHGLLIQHIERQPGWQYTGMRYTRRGFGHDLSKALVDAEAGKYDVLLVRDITSITRSLSELTAFVDRLSATFQTMDGRTIDAQIMRLYNEIYSALRARHVASLKPDGRPQSSQSADRPI